MIISFYGHELLFSLTLIFVNTKNGLIIKEGFKDSMVQGVQKRHSLAPWTHRTLILKKNRFSLDT